MDIFKRCAKCNTRMLTAYKIDGLELCGTCSAKYEIERIWKRCPLCKSTKGFDITQFIFNDIDGLPFRIVCRSCGAIWGTRAIDNPDTKSGQKTKIGIVRLFDKGSNAEVRSKLIKWGELLEWWMSGEVDEFEEKQVTILSGTSIRLFRNEFVKYEINRVTIIKIDLSFVTEARLVLTNFRLLLFTEGASFSEKNRPTHDFTRSIEFADIASIDVSPNTIKIFFTENTELNLYIKNFQDVVNLKRELDVAIKSKLSLIAFEEEEKILYKQPLFFKGESFRGSDPFCWASVFNSMSTAAALCITNKRIIFYRIEQVENLVASDNISTSLWSTQYLVSANWLKHPSLRIIIIPLADIKIIELETNSLGGTITMKLTNIASAWHLEDSFVIPASLIDCEYAKRIPIKASDNSGKEYGIALFDPSKKYAPKIIETLQQVIPEKIYNPDLSKPQQRKN
jgi:hypothetical protein